MKISALIEKLKEFPPEAAIFYRKAEGEGYIDYDFVVAKFYPGDICIQATQPNEPYDVAREPST